MGRMQDPFASFDRSIIFLLFSALKQEHRILSHLSSLLFHGWAPAGFPKKVTTEEMPLFI